MPKILPRRAFLLVGLLCTLVACGDTTNTPESRATERPPTTEAPATATNAIENPSTTIAVPVTKIAPTPTVKSRAAKPTPTLKAVSAVRAHALVAKLGDSPNLADFTLAEQKEMPHSGNVVDTYYVGFLSTGDVEPYHLQNFVDIYKDAATAKKGVAAEAAGYIKKGFVYGTDPDLPPADANVYVYAPPAREGDGYAMIMQVGTAVSTVLGFGPPNYGISVAVDIQRAVFARARP